VLRLLRPNSNRKVKSERSKYSTRTKTRVLRIKISTFPLIFSIKKFINGSYTLYNIRCFGLGIEKIPIVEKRTLHRPGGSITISLPPEWFKAHGINPKDVKKLLIVADRDIRIVNPEDEDKVYKEISRMTEEAQI